MASRVKAGSHFSGVLGCFGLGSSSPGPAGMKRREEGGEAGLPHAGPGQRRVTRSPGAGAGRPQLPRQIQTPVTFLLSCGSPSSCGWAGSSHFRPQDPLKFDSSRFGFLEVGERNGREGTGARL